MLGSDNDNLLCSRLLVDAQNIMCWNNLWYFLRTCIVYFLINLCFCRDGWRGNQDSDSRVSVEEEEEGRRMGIGKEARSWGYEKEKCRKPEVNFQ